MKRAEAKKGGILQVIGGVKLVKGLGLLGIAFGLLSLVHKDRAAIISRLIQSFSVDPNGRYFQAFLGKLTVWLPKLPLIALASFFYGALFCVEGVGLLLGKRWAEYLTVFATGSFLPLEIYEIVHHASLSKAVVTALNIAVVVYLVVRLRKNQSECENHAHPSAQPA